MRRFRGRSERNKDGGTARPSFSRRATLRRRFPGAERPHHVEIDDVGKADIDLAFPKVVFDAGIPLKEIQVAVPPGALPLMAKSVRA
ncbi:MAG: hypothetical protein OXC93_06485 [Rhodospirillaceae bacterium]|nr:hypothetical protein [Rhodospirillaceae bacterium]